MSFLLNHGKMIKEKCLGCWNLRMCAYCLAQIPKDNQILTENMLLQQCENSKESTLLLLYKLCILVEFGYKGNENLQVLNKGVHMEKLVVFPLNNDTEILIKGLKENKLYQVVAVSSYIEDRSRLELLQKKSSIYCSTEFEECLTRADAIVFSENTMGYSYDGYQKRVQMALDSGKKIYAGLALLDKIQIDRDKVCILQESELSDEVVSPNKKEIDIPVISVMGLGENCDKFQLQVKIKKVIENRGIVYWHFALTFSVDF